MTAAPHEAGPRWPRDRWISPTALAMYARCPKRIRLQHLDRVDPPWQFWPHLAKGRIAHLALKRIAHALATGREPIDAAEVARMARLHLPHQEFPSPAAYDASVADVERWVACGRRYIERNPAPAWLLIEKNQHRPIRIYPGQSPYTLMARPDAVVQRTDADGSFIEVIDYKTGVVRPEPDPPVLTRYVARDLLQRLYGDPSAAQVRFTYLWLDHAERTEIDLSVEHCTDAWPHITRQIRALASETAWPARPSVLCRYCPYHRNICHEPIPTADHL